MNRDRIKVLIVLGMHRSGTSLLSNWLVNCGLNLGDRLIGPSATNPNGHFEDIDFVKIQDQILLKNGVALYNDGKKKITIDDFYKKKAEKLILQRSALHPQWGWKDPRTCLFLPLWQELVPTATYVVIFRGYQQVVDSLLKRDFQRLEKRYKNGLINRLRLIIHRRRLKKQLPTLANKYLIAWSYYNRCLIDFLEKNNTILAINANEIKEMDKNTFNYLIKEGFELDYVPINSLFNPKYWDTAKKYSFKHLLDEKLIQRAEHIFSFFKDYTQTYKG